MCHVHICVTCLCVYFCRGCVLYSFSYFIHAHRYVCATVDVQSAPNLYPLTTALLSEATASQDGLQGKHLVCVVWCVCPCVHTNTYNEFSEVKYKASLITCFITSNSVYVAVIRATLTLMSVVQYCWVLVGLMLYWLVTLMVLLRRVSRNYLRSGSCSFHNVLLPRLPVATFQLL